MLSGFLMSHAIRRPYGLLHHGHSPYENTQVRAILCEHNRSYLRIFAWLIAFVEHTGFEPVTSSMPWRRAPNCANAPYHAILSQKRGFGTKKIIKIQERLRRSCQML